VITACGAYLVLQEEKIRRKENIVFISYGEQEMKKENFILYIIKASCVLHNYLRDEGSVTEGESEHETFSPALN
jgi:hypothetical protein